MNEYSLNVPKKPWFKRGWQHILGTTQGFFFLGGGWDYYVSKAISHQGHTKHAPLAI
jgi:hypothetical protein